jgi:WD40 repeat protein
MRAAIAILLCFTFSIPAFAQNDRRDRQEPELVIEPGGRTGTCDALIFSDDGKLLFAVGDDKVVRVFPNGKDGLDGSKMQVLRWPAWREQRGGIKALAASPDGIHVVVGGYGLRSSTVARINRVTGEVEEITYPEALEAGENYFSVMSAAFDPDGKIVAFGTADGSVWAWEPGKKPKRVGKQLPPAGIDGKREPFNRIRLVAFLKSGRILSVAESGQIQAWQLDGFEKRDEDLGALFPKSGRRLPVFRAALSRDKEWLAVGGKDHSDVVVYNLRTYERKLLTLPDGHFARALAFDRDAKRLAIAAGSLPSGAKFAVDADDRIFVVDNPTTAEKLVLQPGPANSYRAEALAFDPAGRLGVAGGDDHETTLWDLAKKGKPVSIVRGSGRNLWGVRISESGATIGFQPRRDATNVDPNRRGKGEFVGFDLARCKPIRGDITWIEPLTTVDGWTVEPDAQNRFIWYAVNAERKLRLPIPIDKDYDEAPRCFTFLKATKTAPVRLIVGHYYGCSIFDVTAKEVKRRFIGVGHAGEVLSVAPSKDQSWFVTAGTDQTVAAWTVADWPSQALLGAEFEVKDGELFVKKVDIGSPAWEMGLVEKDRIVLMVIADDNPIYNRSGVTTGRYGPETGKPEDCLGYLKNPTAGTYLHLGWKRGNNPKLIEQVTSMPRRPLWKFFPSFDEKLAITDWIAWMWKNSFYHTSTNGDFLVGWHVNHPSLDGTAKFYRAEQFREQFHKPNVVQPLLTDRKFEEALKKALGKNPVPLNFGAMEPAPVQIEPAMPVLGPDGMDLTLDVRQRGSNPDLLPERVELWINDYLYQTWNPGGMAFTEKIRVPANRFRDGRNQVTLQTFNRLGGRGEAVAMSDVKLGTAEPHLLGMFVGINDYQNVKAKNPDGSRAFGDLKNARNDAEQLRNRWLQQMGKGKLFSAGDPKEFLDADAKRQALLKRLDELADEARPDDLLVIFLSGHGDYVRPPAAKGEEPKPGVFVYCCPDYDREKNTQTGISTEVLVKKLAKIPCRKLVLLDACHSGEAASTNLVRDMAPFGKGLTVMAACDQQELAYEHEKFKNGLFTYAVMEALGPNFSEAAGADGILEPGELFQYVRNRLPSLLKEIGKDEFDQNPICFPREPERFAIGKK